MWTRWAYWRFGTRPINGTRPRRPYRHEVNVLREQLESAKALIHPSEGDWRQAWEGYRRGTADQAGIVDHVSFVVMRRLGLTHAFTNDRHYRSAGFATLF